MISLIVKRGNRVFFGMHFLMKILDYFCFMFLFSSASFKVSLLVQVRMRVK